MPSSKRTQNVNRKLHRVASAVGLSRRDFVKRAAAGAGGLALAGKVTAAFADASDVIRIGFISPRTGPLGGFGECDPYVLGVARKALANGLMSGGKKYKVEIIDKDSQSDPARASQLAKGLINNDNIDLMLTTSTPEVVNPVADACDAAGMPCVSTILPWESWYFGRGGKPGQKPFPFKWSFHFSFGVAQFAQAYISEWGSGAVPTNKKVGVMFPNDADGNALREHMIPLFEKAGFTVFDPGGYEDGTTDYSAQIAKYKAANVQIFTGVPIPPDFATFWRQAAQLGFAKTVKIQSIAKTGLFPTQMEALGSLAYNIASLCYWHPTFPYKSPLTGHTSQELANGYEKSTGRQWNQQLGGTQSLLDVGGELLKSTNPKNKQGLVDKMETLKVTTAVGTVDFGHGPVPHVSTTPLIGAQWIKAKAGSKHKLDLVIVNNADDPNVPVGAKLQPYS
ncbi:MAG: ABC transporter substrate-binding protein [Hyphomicrobiales bacterium]|nr:ABC transporter substrate-binding protein [Hyphomicrobiales bacterium]MDE2372881.1 ABC transporter substrate-binding protein [Hyphomicrobiales bacterium]